MNIMILVAKSIIDGHIYQSNPYTDENKNTVIQNMSSDLKSSGLEQGSDYVLVEMEMPDFLDTFSSQ